MNRFHACLQYRHMVREHLFEIHFGMPNMFVPIVELCRNLGDAADQAA